MEFSEQLFRLGQIILIDLIFAGDNAIVIAMVASRFSPDYRRKVIMYGIGIAVVLRIVFALITVQLLQIPGINFIGGALLAYICWTLWKDLREADSEDKNKEVSENSTQYDNPPLGKAIIQIAIADISMSLDNVVAVASLADGHSDLLIIGLAISIIFMMFFATVIAQLLQKHRWIGYVGLAVIAWVAFDLLYKGSFDILTMING